MKNPGMFFAAMGCALLVAACGGDDEGNGSDQGSSGSATGALRAEVVDAIDTYYAAATADEACASMTIGLQAYLSGDDPPVDPSAPANEDCPRVVERAVENERFVYQPDAPVEVEAVTAEDDMAAARVLNSAFSPIPYGVFLVEGGDSWLVTSENRVPVEFQDLWDEIKPT